MMDLREIIKWFIPCFHILQVILKLKDFRLTFICLFLLLNSTPSFAANVNSVEIKEIDNNGTKNVDYLVYEDNSFKANQSYVAVATDSRQLSDASVGRTFGRPFKKMMGALLPIIFQIGAASTWAVVAALVGVKTLVVTVVILKLLLIAGAAKLGAVFGAKQHQQHHGWEPHQPQKEIHLHIHNGHHEVQEDHGIPVYGSWNREGAASPLETKSNVPLDPYNVGPQTISTPFGNYVKVPTPQQPIMIKRK